MSAMPKLFTVAIGEHRGHERIWLETKRLLGTQFTTGTRISVVISKNKIVIKTGVENHASGKMLGISKIHSRYGKPVLDISNQDVGECFPDVLKVTVSIVGDTITITPSIKDEALGGYRPLKNSEFVEFFAGGGLLTASLRKSGYTPIMAIERDADYILTYEKNNPDTIVYQSDVLDIDYRRLVKGARLVVLGIPCTRFSNLRIDLKKERILSGEPAEGWETIRIIHSLATALDFMNADQILVEEVPAFMDSLSENLLLTLLQAQSYHIAERTIVRGADFGSMSTRERYCLIMSKDPALKLEIVPEMNEEQRTIGDILEVPAEEREWYGEGEHQSVDSLLAIEKRHKEKGRGFRLPRFTVDDKRINTLSADYYRKRVSDPVLFDGKSKYSFFTYRELARLHGLDDSFVFMGAPSTNCRIIGQGVLVDVFASVGRQLMAATKALENDSEAAAEPKKETPPEVVEPKRKTSLFDFMDEDSPAA